MKIIINKNKIELTPQNIKELTLNFSLLHGRRFSLKPQKGKKGFKDISFNCLIEAVKKEASLEQNKNELKEFFRVFTAFKDRGYSEINAPILKENFLVQIITRIKHFFSGLKRNKLFKEMKIQIAEKPQEFFRKPILGQKDFPIMNIGEWNEIDKRLDQLRDPFNLALLPKDMQLEILRKLDNKSLLSIYRTGKVARNLIRKEMPKELKTAQFEEQAFFQWHRILFDPIEISDDEKEKHFENLTKKLMTSYSKEIAKAFKNTFLKIKGGQEIDFRVFNLLIKTSQTCALAYPQVFGPLYEYFILNVDNNSLQRKCLIALSSIDPIKAFSFKNILRLKRDDPHYIQCQKEQLLMSMVKEGALFNPEKVFEIVNSIENEYLKARGFESLICSYPKLGEEAIPFIQKIMDGSQFFSEDNKKYVIREVAIAYAGLGKLEESLEVIQQVKYPLYSTLYRMIQQCKSEDTQKIEEFLQEILIYNKKPDIDDHASRMNPEHVIFVAAKVYEQIDLKKARLLLDEIPLPGKDHDKASLAMNYISIDYKKAQEIADKIKDPKEKIKVLLRIAKFLKTKNPEMAKIACENAQNLVRQFMPERNISKLAQKQIPVLLKILKVKSEINKNFVDPFLKRHRQINFQILFKEGLVRRRGYESFFSHDKLPLLVNTFALLKEEEVEKTVKESLGIWEFRNRPLLSARLLLSLSDAFNEKENYKIG